MPRLKVIFDRCIQDAQEFGSDDEFMVSRVFFTIEVGGRTYGNLHANLKQTVGSNYATGAIEVGPPIGYDGSFNHEAFAEAAKRYYRSVVGPGATGIRIEGDAQNI